ncbi:hypothetical protein CBR_g19593 [Chara braunii]|uniref:Reverse transcriptase domain-containing protein n=1 Tax=Chara braunii TaxID=69332 RepID=A0A388KYD9_CHABU|nr:hypothetical protein CBR_g19593 [Chara braunii]|eukprot:GBG75080.1 hypothetical protein CBR_g19593 [Chara braunii]
MSDRDTTSEDDRILRSARRPIAHLALEPEGDRYLFRQLRERQKQQRRARAAEASRVLVSEAATSEAMATSAQQTSQASSSGSVGSTVVQTQSQSAGVMASQPLVLSPEEIAIQHAALQEAQLQKALREIKAEKERMIRRRARLQRRQADTSELEEMDPPELDDLPAVSQPVQPQGTQPLQSVQQPVSQGPQPGVMQGPGQSQWVPKTAIAAPKPCTRDKRGEDLDTWLRAVSVYVKCKLTLPHEEVLVAASYLEGSATRWLSGLVQLQEYGHDFHAWAAHQKLEDFLKMLEDRWHDPQEAQKPTDAILTLYMRQFKSVREATDVVERLICVPGVRYDPQVLLTSYLRCFPMPLRNQLAGEANINMHNFPSFGKKALDLEAKIGHGHNPMTDGRKKKLPPNSKAKGRIMFVDKDGSTIELGDNFQEGVGSEAGSVEASGGGVVAAVAQKGEPVKMSAEIEGVVAKYPDLFEEPTWVVEREVVHAIEMIPGSSIPKGMIYRMSPSELDELCQQLKELIEKGWIRPSVSPYGSPVLFVPKKKEGTLRMCIHYRGLNAITVKNREPLPRIDDLLDRVQGCRNFSKIDLKSGYHQIAIRPEDRHKTAFQTRYGLYEFVVMPFGLCNVPGTFQHAMNRIFHDYLDKFVIVYLDDILIFSKTVEEHVALLDKVLSLLRQHKFKINGEKCEFGRTRVLYLGHEIFAEGLKPDDAKVASIRDCPRPQSVNEMRSFLGMTGYYRNFVKNYSIVGAPLTDLTRLDTPWEWTDRCEAAFRQLKHALTHHEVLKLPDPDKPFLVTTDASQYGIGAVPAVQKVEAGRVHVQKDALSEVG